MNHTHSKFARLLAIGCVIASMSCNQSTEPEAAHVRFKLDAPTCGSLSFRFAIDYVDVDTLMLAHDHYTPVYATTAGEHAVTTRFPNGVAYRDTTVMLRAGQTYTDVIPFYCS